jgi:hypothetical protein
MNPDQKPLPGVDAALEQFSREAVPADVERRLEARLQEFSRRPQPGAGRDGSAPPPRRYTIAEGEPIEHLG